VATDIKYLAMEGGGGKGFAYLGALQVLERLNVLDNIEGYAGASAGAITAFMLSIGYTSSELKAFLANNNFDLWWEPASPRLMPSVGQYIQVTSPLTKIDITLGAIFNFARAPLIAYFVMTNKINKQPFSNLARDFTTIGSFLYSDMGMFPGLAPRELFNQLINQKVQNKNLNKSFPAMTFDEHLKIFQKRLVITGTNVSTGMTEIFSASKTPNFPVADAVRISMGLPFIFKPYVLSQQKAGFPACGTYVDGGVFNNIPYRELDGENTRVTNTSPPAPGTAPATTNATNHTLLLRLGLPEPSKINNFWLLLKNALKTGILGSGESQVMSRHNDQTIMLDTEGLDLVDFKPEQAIKDKIEIRSRRKAYAYFGLPIPAVDDTDAAKEDQKAAEVRLSKASKGACD
jgi:predicted acylesterase/phospholipase RssA